MLYEINEYKGTQIIQPDKAAEVFRAVLNMSDVIDREKEHLWVMGLNIRNKIIYIECVSMGIISETLVHPREVFKRSILNNASSILICHNHPSQEASPSDNDFKTTKQLTQAGEIIGIKVLDHIIITQNSYYSITNAVYSKFDKPFDKRKHV